jgi:predicted amidohydrolase
MPTWRVAGVQMDCRLGRPAENLAAVRARLAEAADRGARLVVFPECILTGYGFASPADAHAVAEPVPGPAADAVAADCARLGVWAVYGTLERAGDKLYNAAAVVGPTGYFATYRKTHLPCLGVDRFTDPGDGPLAVHDLGGLRIGVGICFDGGFPEVARVQTLLGADLLLLPTNWPTQSLRTATLVPRVRAFENRVYHLAVNRVGDEAGYHFIGHSSLCDPFGDYLEYADHDREAVLVADVDPEAARRKRVVYFPGEFEIDRVGWRRPELYGPLTEPQEPFRGHFNR